MDEKLENESKAERSRVWHIAALTRAKKLPKFETFVGIKKETDPKALAASLKATLRGFKGRKAKG